MGKLLMCYVAFDRIWYGKDWFLPEPPGWISNLCSRYAARCRTRCQSDLAQRTLDEMDFFSHCLTHLLHESTQSRFRIVHYFSLSGVLPQRSHIEMLWGRFDSFAHTGLDEERALLSSELLTWLRRSYQVPQVSSAPTSADGSAVKYTTSAILDKIRAVDEPISLGKWCAALQALVAMAPQMFSSKLHRGTSLQKNHDRCVFHNTINRVIEVLLKNNCFDLALELLQLAHHDTPSNPFHHASFVRVFQRYVTLLTTSGRNSPQQQQAVDYLLQRLMKLLQTKDTAMPEGGSLQTRLKPNSSIQATYISIYLTHFTHSSVTRQILPLLRRTECFPLGFIEASVIDRCLSGILNSVTHLSGFTYVVSTLLKVSNMDLVRRLALRDISECRSWEGALYRLQLYWDKTAFDRSYEKAALRAVLQHSHRRHCVAALRWDVVLEAMTFHKIPSGDFVSEWKQLTVSSV
ncbi:hypothetical protein XU18_5135 [Perkinsela sp. CCAP 1560/4]|nr:hypothetical protein XU18_5135 [Perkinsela sp. CCAP 1560/4]|eukprot:KNH01767.1 hypothetical protein XU18_5135 [Perkinsela sp. CCAP 1560/4]